jgi:PAS domain S-box-containing protein
MSSEAATDRVANILIVDDVRENLIAVVALLERPEYRLVTASSGEAALRELLKQEEFALILLDLRMPGMDGLEVARIAKQRARIRDVPIIFVTAEHDHGDSLTRAYELGAADFIGKPFEAVVLQAKVAVFVELYFKTRDLERKSEELRRHEREEQERRGRAEREASEAHLRNVTDAVPVLIWTANAKEAVTGWNRAFSVYTGITFAASAAQDWTQVQHPEDRVRVMKSWAEAVEKGQPLDVELRLRRVDGAFRWHMLRAQPERDAHGVVQGWVATAVDIEDQKALVRTERELAEKATEARNAAERANQAKDEFLATISHELRTPLTSIMGWVRLLQSKQTRTDRREHGLRVIERNAITQARLIDDLLDVSRITSGKLELRLRSVALVEPVEAAVETLRPAAEAKRITLVMPELRPEGRIQGDRARLQQIFWNLLSNAVKFTPEGGSVTIAMQESTEKLSVRVSDTGAGMEPAFIPVAFEPFRQEDRKGLRKQGGLGLGLAIVKQLVELHGGQVSATSEIGKGTTFTVTFTREPEGIWALPRATPLPGELHAGALAGARVIACTTAAEALRDIAQRPDALVCTARAGSELLPQLRSLSPEQGGLVPAVALAEDPSETDDTLEPGFQGYVAAPLVPEALVHALSQLGMGTP